MRYLKIALILGACLPVMFAGAHWAPQYKEVEKSHWILLQCDGSVIHNETPCN